MHHIKTLSHTDAPHQDITVVLDFVYFYFFLFLFLSAIVFGNEVCANTLYMSMCYMLCPRYVICYKWLFILFKEKDMKLIRLKALERVSQTKTLCNLALTTKK